MFGPLLFGFFALIHGAIALAALTVAGNLLLPALCLFLVEAVTAFDNGATVAGNRLGIGPTAEKLSRMRFLLHAVCIGLLVPVYTGIAGKTAFTGTGALVADGVGWILAIAIIFYGYFKQYRGLRLIMPVSALGCLRYAQSVTEVTRYPGYAYSDAELNQKGELPFASVMATTVGLIVGLLIGWFGGFWVPFIATAIMFVAGAFPQKGWGPIATSGLEIIYSSGMLYSLIYAASL
jgi:hypothetical protein